MHPRLRSVLDWRGIDSRRFEKACSEAAAYLGESSEFESINTRNKLAAALIATPGGRACDFGGNVAAYNLVARLLDTDVTVVDDIDIPEASSARLKRLQEAGIRFEKCDVYQFKNRNEAYDVVSAFETIEHFPHSPKPALVNMIGALRKKGRLCLSVPNIARVDMRLRALAGRSVHERYQAFFSHVGPYPGHHREYTLDELKWIAAELNLATEDLFGANCTVESKKKKSSVQRFLISLEEDHGVGDMLLRTRSATTFGCLQKESTDPARQGIFRSARCPRRG
jgi:2-polyprenyl-3-methyl-5-hydroxy-6-metoxy-1,4-benzoquinol methylase